MVRNPPANSGDAGDLGLIPGSGRFPGGGHSNPLQYSSLENPMDGLHSMGLQRVGHDWSTLTHRHTKSSALKCIPLALLSQSSNSAPSSQASKALLELWLKLGKSHTVIMGHEHPGPKHVIIVRAESWELSFLNMQVVKMRKGTEEITVAARVSQKRQTWEWP